MNKLLAVLIASLTLSACGGLQKKAALVSIGDTKAQVMAVMGAPDDTQAKENREVWQYCQTGAGFGWHDYRVFWFERGQVTASNSYKVSIPGSCLQGIKQVNWADAPDSTIEIRHR